MRAQLEKKLAQKEKEKKEQKLVELAQKAREERAGIRAAAGTVLVHVGSGLLQQVYHGVRHSKHFIYKKPSLIHS